MTPLPGQRVVRAGVIILILSTLGSALTHLLDQNAPPENTWGDNLAWPWILALFWVRVVLEGWYIDFTAPTLLSLHTGAFIGVTVFVIGAVIHSARRFFPNDVSARAAGIMLAGLPIAVVCAVSAHFIGPLEPWSVADATHGMWLVGGFMGISVFAVGLVMTAVAAWVRHRGYEGKWRDHGVHLAIVGCVIMVLCIETGVIVPDASSDVVLILILCLTGIVGCVVSAVGLAMAATAAVVNSLTPQEPIAPQA